VLLEEQPVPQALLEQPAVVAAAALVLLSYRTLQMLA
jgi:hypothetical protein